jgi:carbamoyltransferase
VLALATTPNVKARLNQLLKKRDWFMPYAPAMLEEEANRYFPGQGRCSYMNRALQVNDALREELGEAVHKDGSVRVQTVAEDENPRFAALLKAVKEKTGRGVVLNTSFNRHGLPTVCTPKQALDHLVWGCIDELFIGPFKVVRKFCKRKQGKEKIASEEELLRKMGGGIWKVP